jgi:hypothetical protein
MSAENAGGYAHWVTRHGLSSGLTLAVGPGHDTDGMPPMRTRRYLHLGPLLLLIVLAGCMANTQTVKPTAAIFAQRQVPEAQLLDVGIRVFESTAPEEADAAKDDYNPGVRKAEAHYIPFHLKNTLQRTGHWGAVRVTPGKAESVDVLVKGTILESNGEELLVEVQVHDVTGNTWFVKRYRAEATGASYDNTRKGERDPFQDLYNAVCNDMLAYKQRLAPADIRNLRRVSKLKFAADMAPDAFGGYLQRNGDGRYSIKHLPADDDPMMQRAMRIRERDYMLIDTVNQFYSRFYDEMWEPYAKWRESYLDEAKAKHELERKALTRKLLGVAAILGGVAIGSSASDEDKDDKRHRYRADVGNLMILGGAYSFKTGMDASADARIHADALRELGASFGADIQPVVMEVEGRTVKLHGSAEEQYRDWRQLLHEIFAAETGLAPAAAPAQAASPE